MVMSCSPTNSSRPAKSSNGSNGIQMLSVQVPGAMAVEGEGLPRCHPITAASGEFIRTYDDSVKTLYDTFARSARVFADLDFLGTRRIENGEGKEYVFETYAHVAKRVRDFAAGLKHLGLKEKANVGLFSINRSEWIIAEHGCFHLNLVTVPLYDTLGDEAIEYIVNQTEMEIAVVATQKLPLLVKLSSRLPMLKKIVVMDNDVDGELLAAASSQNIEIIKFGELEERGRKTDKFEPTPPAPEDLCTICYTSGTTGMPKGVMLTHAALLASSAAGLCLVGQSQKYPNDNPLCQLDCPGEVYLSYLPLAHVMERVVFNTLIMIGFKFGFYQGDVNKLLNDIEELKPTFFISVPRLFNRVHDKVRAGVAAKGGVAEWLFNYAYGYKLDMLRQSGELKHWLWDRLVFAAIRAKLGGRVKAMLTGSAPLSSQVIDFLRVVFSVPVFEGYGMTESAAITTLTAAGDMKHGQIGVPTPSVEIKLVDIPEMGYTSKDVPNARGEIWIRGASVFCGYYKDPENTTAILKDGWIVTGDVGMWDAAGRLFLIDRKKSLFKLAQGEYVAPEKIEATLCHSHKIAQAYVEGNSLKSHLVAVVVPDREILVPWARAEGISGTYEEVCAHPSTKAAILADIQKLGSAGSKQLKGFEVPKALHVEHEMFTVENGLITPTFKLKRPVVKKKYADIVTRLYEDCEQ